MSTSLYVRIMLGPNSARQVAPECRQLKTLVPLLFKVGAEAHFEIAKYQSCAAVIDEQQTCNSCACTT